MGLIYLIQNVVNDKMYVGQTTRSIERRWRDHKRFALKKGSRTFLHAAIRKYGPGCFSLTTLEICPTQLELNCAEQSWIDRLSCFAPSGYNLTKGGGGMSGWKMPASSREKIVKFHKGKVISEEQKKKQRAKMLGRRASAETIAKFVIARTGKKRSAITAKRIGDAHRGRKQRPEVVAARAAAQMGRRISEHSRAAISRAVVAGGEKYPSIKDAADKLGVSLRTIQRRIEMGKPGYLAEREPRPRKKRNAGQIAVMKERISKPVFADGTRYSSMTDAAVALGITRPGVRYRILVGWPGYSMVL